LIRGQAIHESSSSAERLIDLVAKLGQDPAGYDATAVIVADWREAVGDNSIVEAVLSDEFVPPNLRIGRFMQVMVDAVLARTPVDAHVRVRELRSGHQLAVREDESR
jgi:hypothetical protein